MASDLSFNIVALDRASATFVKVAEQLDQVAARLDRLDGKTANVDVNVKTDDSQKALDSFTNRWALMSAGIIAGSPAIGAAIIGGVGAGFIGVAALAQKSNEQVQQTYSTLWSNVVEDTKAATAGLVPVIVDAGNQLGATFTRLGPVMSAGFAAAGPEIVSLTNGVTNFAQNAMPGLVSMLQRSQPVFTALAGDAGTLGTAVGNAFQQIGANSQSTAGFVTSLGNILSSTLGLAVNLMNDVATVWAQNGTQIDAAIQGIADVASGLASGAMPVLSAALGAAAQIVTTLASVLSPLSGTLGFVATAALAAWAAFKGAGLVSDGVRAAATAVASWGTSIEAGAAKAAGFMAASQGVAVESSAMAAATRSAGAAAATAATGFGVAADTLAGPLGIAIAAVTVGLALFSSSSSDATSHTQDLKSAQDSLTSALEQSDGAITGQVVSTLTSQQAFKDAADATKQYGISQQDLISIATQGGPKLDDLRAKLEAITKANHEIGATAGGTQFDKGLNDTGKAAQDALDKVNDLAKSFKGATTEQQQNAQAVQQHTAQILNSEDAFQGVNNAAQAAGIGFSFASDQITKLGDASKDTNFTIQDLLETFNKQSLAVANAGGQIASTFKQADQQVTTASQGVANAQHGVAQAAQGVADAQHSEAQAAQQVTAAQQGVAAAAHGVEQAQRSVRDAIQAVSQAQYQYNQSLQAERDAEQALSDARQQAVRDIQAVHDALNNAQTSQANARLNLFTAQQTAAGMGVTDQNAQQLAYNTPITSENQSQVKAAVDLISAQNQLSQATTQATNAKQDSAKADAAGVNGAQSVIQAQRSLVDSQRAVTDAARGVQRANEQVQDASFSLIQAQQGLQRAQDAVRDAAYAQQKAHQAVRDAQYQQQQASQQLTTAQGNLKDAQDNASRALDLNTEAGRRNLTQLYALNDAIKSQFGNTQQGWTQLVNDTASAFGWSTTQAENYLKQLNLIPKDFEYSTTAHTQVDTKPLADFANQGGYYSGGFRAAGGNLGFADGGPVYGIGGPRSDSIDAKLSHGEYVQPTDVVNHYGIDYMDALRKKQIPRFADGGLATAVDLNLAGAGYSTGYELARNAALIAGADAGKIPQLPKWEPPVAFSGSIPSPPGSGVQRWSSTALAAMGLLGIPPNYLGAVLRRMQQESGGNPTIVNDWDTNWIAGHPSVGLMQVIRSTFAGNAGPFANTGPFSYGVSVDPEANIYAGLNYAGRRYGGGHGGFLGGVLYAMNKPGGYDNGGQLQPGWTSVYNGTGKPENVRTADAEDALLKAMQQVKSAVDRLAASGFNGTLRTERGAFLGEVTAALKDLTEGAGV